MVDFREFNLNSNKLTKIDNLNSNKAVYNLVFNYVTSIIF